MIMPVIQYWEGDEPQALALARLLTDLELGQVSRRTGRRLMLARRSDCRISTEAAQTIDYCQRAFTTMFIQSNRPETGHPDGCFGLWAGTVDTLYQMLIGGIVSWTETRYVFMAEADGAPVRRDWLDRLDEAHQTTMYLGKRVTGAMMDWPHPHVNGNLVMDLRLWADYPSLHECPNGVAWDLHHGPILLREARDGHAILNVCGSKNWTPEVLSKIATQTAWIHGCKDESVFNYARSLTNDS